MLCTPCTRKGFITVPGYCYHCGGYTPSSMLRLCDSCSQSLDECASCRTPMQTSTLPPSGTPSAWTIKKNTNDNGSTVNLKVDDELEVTLHEDQGNYKEWKPGYVHDRSILSTLSAGVFQPGKQWGKGTRSLTFKALAPGKTTLEIVEHQLWGGGTTGTKWTVTVNVKR